MEGYIKWYWNNMDIGIEGPILSIEFDKPMIQGYYECSSINQDGTISRARGLLTLLGRMNKQLITSGLYVSESALALSIYGLIHSYDFMNLWQLLLWSIP